MKRIVFPLLVAVMTTAIALSSPASAQDAQKGMPTFADCDLNGDGTITELEFTKARG